MVGQNHRASLNSRWLWSCHTPSPQTSCTSEDTYLQLFKASVIWLFTFMQQNPILMDFIILIFTPWGRHAQCAPNISTLLHVSQSLLQSGWGCVSSFDQGAVNRSDMCLFCIVLSPALSALLQCHWKAHVEMLMSQDRRKRDPWITGYRWASINLPLAETLGEINFCFAKSLRFQSLLPQHRLAYPD